MNMTFREIWDKINYTIRVPRFLHFHFSTLIDNLFVKYYNFFCKY